MSVDSLILVAFLIVLPLLERLVRVLRARTSQPAEKPTVRPPLPRPAGIPPSAATPPALPPPHPAAEQRSAGERIGESRIRQHVGAAVPMGLANRPSHPRHTGSLKSADLRRAMMLIAILGKCKALEGETGSVATRS
jgi:hypothetical protein